MFRWFENLIEAFPEDPPAKPPESLLAFYAYFIQPVWPAFAVLLVIGIVHTVLGLHDLNPMWGTPSLPPVVAGTRCVPGR